MPSALVQTTVRAVAEHVAGSTLVATSSGSAVALAREVMNAMNAFGLAAAGMAFLTAQQPPPALSPRPPAQAPIRAEQAAVDRHGDPLPAHAVARLGTVRLRHGVTVIALAFSRDGQSLATVGNDGQF